jgi:hypothetical protein
VLIDNNDWEGSAWGVFGFIITLRREIYIDRLQTPIGRALLLTHAEETLRAFDWDYRTTA